jgi:hypothetical protein
MNEERILALDISTKTGYASMVSTKEGIDLETYGTIPAIHMPEGAYPSSFVVWAGMCYQEILRLIDQFAPDCLVIEETVAGSKGVYSQKILEYIHYLVAKFIKETNIKSVYLLTGQWRSEVGCKMTKEESNHNKEVKKYKDKNKSRLAYDAKGKVIGKLTKKHINVRRANELFGLNFTIGQNDMADAILLGYAYHSRKYGKKT